MYTFADLSAVTSAATPDVKPNSNSIVLLPERVCHIATPVVSVLPVPVPAVVRAGAVDI